MIALPSASRAHEAWADASPFPHFVFPDALDRRTAAACGREFPTPDGPWHTFTGELEAGKQEGAASIAGPCVAALHEELASDAFVAWLRTVSGVEDLVADPDRHGGGIHQSGPGARLGTHVDFNVRGDLVRAVNVIVFVGDQNEWRDGDGWRIDTGGLLELGADSDVKVVPRPGVLVVFEASNTSWHGHPVPMVEGSPLRKSVPAYFYRPLADGEQIEQHSTRFLAIERSS
jgi:hypothetical protein